MSAYVVEPKTINRILAKVWKDWFSREAGKYEASSLLQGLEWECATSDGCADLGQAMYNLNINAVGQRHGDCTTLNDLPGAYDDKGLLPYRFESESCSDIQAIKSLECWLYQCSEGTVPDNSKLFQAFTEIVKDWISAVFHNLPEYNKADWE